MCPCQQNTTSQALEQPWRGRGRGVAKEIGQSYQSFEKNLMKFHELGKVPLNVCTQQLNDGSGIAATLQKNRGQWHKNCRNLFTDLKLDRIEKRALETADESDESCVYSPVKRRSSIQGPHCSTSDQEEPVCFFCDQKAGPPGLHNASTFGLDKTVRMYATKLRDTKLLAKLAPGDMVASTAIYHKDCLTNLFNRYRKQVRLEERTESAQDCSDLLACESIALAELISYIEEQRLSATAAAIPVFRLADLVTVYSERLTELNPDYKGNVNSTRLKERLLGHCPYLKAAKQGRDILLTYDTAIGDAILQACSDNDSEAIHLAKAAAIVRKQLFEFGHAFSGSLCEEDTTTRVPKTLLALVNMILDGPSIESQSRKEKSANQAAKTISQLIVFNSVKKTTRHRKSVVRHNSDREVPIPLYLGLKMHVQTRKRKLIDCLHMHGLSISYDRVLRISSSVAHSIIKQFENDGVVCPPQLKNGLFTTGQVDNIDHNPSSVTSDESFHGTAHSLCQHPTQDNHGTDRNRPVLEDNITEKRIPPLPLSYTNILPAPQMPKVIKAPIIAGPVTPKTNKLLDDEKVENRWLQKLVSVFLEETVDKDDFVSWAAFHASLQDPNNVKLPTPIALMPMFREASHSVAMIMHCMKTNQEATQLLNPGQVPVLTMDQPLYAIGKQIQWKFSNLYGEDKYVVMLGPLHTEMASLKVIGDLLEGSGWTNALAQADVATPGTADSFLHGSHVTKTRRAHQVTMATLHILRRRAYEEVNTSTTDRDLDSEKMYLEWCGKMRLEHPMFNFWSMVFDLERTLLAFVRAIRTSDFELYVETLGKLAPWFFAMDHVHYARWLPVHIRDMSSLQQRCPEVYDAFMRGAFTSNKTGNTFSAIGLDQAHEQVNARVKGDGGAIGLTESPGALRRWMVAGPQLSEIVAEYELEMDPTDAADTGSKHHDQSHATQRTFLEDVQALVRTMEELGNPFLDQSKDLSTIDSQDILSQCVADSIEKIERLGTEQFNTFIEERLVKNETAISAPISRNSLLLFKSKSKAGVSKDKQKVLELKNDCSLFSRLYIASQMRESNLEEFFKHENQLYPPSISSGGKLREGKKSDLVDCLQSQNKDLRSSTPIVDVRIFDGAAVVHFLPVGEAKTFGEYAKEVFLPYVMSELQKSFRVDIVWDVYLKDSLKLSTRESRGTGARRRVSQNVKLPGNWKNFLRNDNNKDELFQFLANECVANDTENKVIVSTLNESVVSSSPELQTERLQPCTQEEADSRILLHVQDAVLSGFKTVMIRTVDTDVVVLAVASFGDICNLQELWIAFGTGKDFRYIPIHEIVSSIGPQKARGLLFFHAFTGCDTTAYFANYGKKSAWNTWIAMPEITEIFVFLSSPCTLTEEVIGKLERFVVLMYSRTSDDIHVNAARMNLFTKCSRNIDNIPPTRAALEEHIKRSVYQAGYIWGQCLQSQPQLPCANDWGWRKSEDGCYKPMWTTLPVAEKACLELIACGCTKSCSGNCKCVKTFKTKKACTQLCKCNGNCYEV